MPHNGARPQGPGTGAALGTAAATTMTRLVVEKVARTDTARAGGNAGLMSLAGE